MGLGNLRGLGAFTFDLLVGVIILIELTVGIAASVALIWAPCVSICGMSVTLGR